MNANGDLLFQPIVSGQRLKESKHVKSMSAKEMELNKFFTKVDLDWCLLNKFGKEYYATNE